MRRAVVVGIVSVFAVLGGSVFPAGAQQEGESLLVFRKVVSGPATGGFAMTVACEGSPTPRSEGEDVSEQATMEEIAVLGFDATGAPTTVEGFAAGFFSIVDGAWVGTNTVPPSELDNPDCTVTETDAGGAATTSWTCDFEFEAGTPDPPIGCANAAGTGTGPVVATFGDTGDEIESQTWTVVFTNTFPEPVVEVQPTFTG